MENQNSETPQQQDSSMLEKILQTANEPSPSPEIKESVGGGVTPPSPQKPREPLPPGTILKAIGAITFASLIVFASFLAYIVFNPGDAQFFVSMFGIDTKDVANILRKLINGSFGIIILVLSIGWIIALFRAIWTPREQKRKKLLAWMIAVTVGILLFSLLAFWAFLFNKIGETVWDGGVINIYDNTLYSEPLAKDNATIASTSNIIGPIDLRFDITGNARQLESNGGGRIESYEMNFDGARCNDGKSLISGANPRAEQGIVCTFDTIKVYNISGTYQVRDALGNQKSVPMELSPVEVRGLVNIRKQKNTSGKNITTIDASSLKLLGNPRWVNLSTNTEDASSAVTYEAGATPIFIGMKLFGDAFDRVFVIKDTTLSSNGKIIATPNTTNPLEYTFEITGTDIDKNTITDIVWSLDDGTVLCRDTGEVCSYIFAGYGKKTIKVQITLADQSSSVIELPLSIEEPILLSRHLTITDKSGKKLNDDTTFDSVLKAYVIDGVIPPETLTFDARDVVSENPGYALANVRWTFSDGKTVQEKEGERVTFDIANTFRYSITAVYTFKKSGDTAQTMSKTARDSVIVDVEHRSLIPRLLIQNNSDYVPVRVTVDGSQSRSENGEIKKFIYNFGEGKPEAIGDAIQVYEYTTPGEKEITLTIVGENGEKAQTKRTIVLKESPKTLDFTTSLSPGIAGTPVDFSVTGESGQVESYIWNFGDNTPTERGFSVSHTYTAVGSYTVTLTAIYTDGTQKQQSKSFQVVATLE